jgi:plastocyanin
MLLLSCGLPRVTPAATQTVEFGNYYFYPLSLTIKVGDTVNFIETFGGTHTVTAVNPSDRFCGNGAVTNCSVTFNSPGTFPYKCLYHGSLDGMTGVVVVVTASNMPPTVSIISPTNGSVFAAPATATIRATASDRDGTVVKAEFFVNGNSMGSIQTAPYGIVVSNVMAGNYSLTAVATDNRGLSSTSSVVNISVVTPAPLVVSAPTATNGQIQFNYTANPGLRYVIQNSIDLAGWSPIQTNTATSGNVVYGEAFDIRGLRFYRVQRQPNP